MKNLFKDLSRSIRTNIIAMMTVADGLLFVLFFAFSIASFFFVRELFPSGSLVTISVDNKAIYSLSLHEDRTVKASGPLGDNVVEIKNSRVHIKEAPCPNKLCIHQGWVDRGSIICLPNKMVVMVGGDMNRGYYDAVTK